MEIGGFWVGFIIEYDVTCCVIGGLMLIIKQDRLE